MTLRKRTHRNGLGALLLCCCAAQAASGQTQPVSGFELQGGNDFPLGIAFANGQFHVVDFTDEKVFAYSASGQRIREADFKLRGGNDNPTRIAFADGLFYVVDARDKKVYAYSASGRRNRRANFKLQDGNEDPKGIAFANGRFHVVDFSNDKVYAYSVSGERDPDLDFSLQDGNGNPTGIAFADGRFHVVDYSDDKVYAYSVSGERDPVADFNLQDNNNHPQAMTFANGGFHVVDYNDKKVYAHYDSPDVVLSATFSANSTDAGKRFSMAAGERFSVETEIRNEGTLPSSSTHLRHYLFIEAESSANPPELGAIGIDGLAAKAATRQSIGLTAPNTDGCYVCRVCVDAVDGEANYLANNCATSALIVGGMPNLAVSSFALNVPDTFAPGLEVEATMAVRNAGNVMSSPTKLNISGPREVALDVPALASGESATFEVSVYEVGDSFSADDLDYKRYRACVEDSCDASNNCRTQGFLFSRKLVIAAELAKIRKAFEQ